MRFHVRTASVALAGALLVAACGDDGSDSGAGDGTPTETVVESDDTVTDSTTDTLPATTDTTVDTATTEPEQAAQDVEADTAAADAAALTVADLPEEWTERTAELDGRLAACLGVDGDRIAAAAATADTGPFVGPAGNPTIDEQVGVLASERDARIVMARVTEPDVPACFAAAYADLAADVLGGTLVDGAQVGVATAGRLSVGSAGDATQAIRLVVPATADPTVATVTIDHVLVRAGRSLATLTFENRVEPTPVETIDEITALAAAKLPA